jgi:molybdopterin synthase sulfur carrier subunit
MAMTLSPSITVHIPGALRPYCAGESRLSMSADSVRGLLDDMERRLPSLHRNIRDETGAVRRHLNIFINSENVRDLRGLDSPLEPGDVVSILTSVSGG